MRYGDYPTDIQFCHYLPAVVDRQTFAIYDRKLLKVNDRISQWIKSFACRYGVAAGEGLKDLRKFPYHMETIFKKSQSLQTPIKVLSIGGGTLSDFSGFVGSVFKRGTPVTHIPSTWLAAIDSAHGGKTALNILGVKNQLGTFAPAQKVILCKELLLSQPAHLSKQALGEFVKIGLLDSDPWIQRMLRGTMPTPQKLWSYLRPAIRAKYEIVLRDPLERSGVRQTLNLGHTLGHALESYYGWPHGVAVYHGVNFSLEWSLRKKYLKTQSYNEMKRLFGSGLDKSHSFSPIPAPTLTTLLQQDKKRGAGKNIRFVFLKDFGAPYVKSISIAEIVAEACHQGWAR